MSIIYKTCEDADFLHTCDVCTDPEHARVRSVALIKIGTAVTIPLTLEQWTAAVEAGNIIIIPDTTGTFDGGTAKMGAGYGDEKERKLGDDFVLAFKDPSYAINAEFWQDVERAKWNIAFRTEKLLHVVTDNVSINCKAPVSEDKDSDVVWEIEAKWFSKTKPKVSDYTPVASLFKCFEISVV